MKKALLALTTIILSLFLSCIVGEFFLRLFKPQIYYLDFPSGLWLPEKDVCNLPMPHIQSYTETNEFRIEFKHNSLGLRDREYSEKKSAIKRILVLGDSFTWGAGALDNETFPKQLEKLLNRDEKKYEVINAGINSYDTRQEYFYLLKYGLSLKPDILILSFLTNDITGTDGCLYKVNNDGDLVGKDFPIAVRIKRGKVQMPKPFSVKVFLKLNSHLYTLVVKTLERFGAVKEKIHVSSNLKFVYLKEEFQTADTVNAYSIVINYLEKIKDLCDKKGIKLVLLGIPMKEHIDYPDDIGKYDLRRPYELIARWAARHNIPYIDPVEAFRTSSINKKLYWDMDRHMNKDGYYLLGQEIYRFMLNNKL